MGPGLKTTRTGMGLGGGGGQGKIVFKNLRPIFIFIGTFCNSCNYKGNIRISQEQQYEVHFKYFNAFK